jgi:hypothetical protein
MFAKQNKKQKLLYLHTIYDWNRLPHPIDFSGANETLESVIYFSIVNIEHVLATITMFLVTGNF